MKPDRFTCRVCGHATDAHAGINWPADDVCRDCTAVGTFEDLAGIRAADSTPRVASLTPREMQVLERLAGGQSNIEIAATLGISPKTLDIHRANVKHKLGEVSQHAIPRHWYLWKLAEPIRDTRRMLAEMVGAEEVPAGE